MFGSLQYSMQLRAPQFNNTQDIARTPNKYRRSFQLMHHNNYKEEHWCETCDRGFSTTELLDKHKQEHQRCNIDGCQFIAHPKIITKHIQMQHASGLYKKIANLNNPEEIKRWREERKKKYPTKKNIEKKEAERQEKINRGEKIGLKPQCYKKNITGGNMKRNCKFTRENHQYKRCKLQTTNNSNAINSKRHSEQNIFNRNKSNFPEQYNYVSVTSHKLKPFAGIRDIILECTEDEIENKEHNLDVIDFDDGDDSKPISDINANMQAFNQPKVCGALSSLICHYGSSEDEFIESENKTNLNTTSHNIITSNNKKSEQTKDNDSGPEEVKIFKNKEFIDITPAQNNIASQNSNKIKKECTEKIIKKTNFNRQKPKIQSTLLRRLLHTEIQHERNVILQCIRHIVTNNFFET
ncbi:hypothetical protein ACJJTC_009911 [Scirpophaga incertulas]